MLVAEVVAKFVADTSSLDAGTKKAEKAIKDVEQAAKSSSAGLLVMDGAAGRVSSSLQRIGEVAAGIGLSNVIAKMAASLISFSRESVTAAARVEEMDKVLNVLGRNAGVTRTEVDEQTKSIKAMGIETDVAQRTLSEFMRNNLKVADASKLARVAQDSAVVSATDSSAALERLIWGITTRQTEVLRTGGILVSADAAYATYANTIRKSANALSETEKSQAILNAVLREGLTLEGAYEASMESASKQLRSRTRYIEELKEGLGTMGVPLYAAWVFGINDMIKIAGDAFAVDGPINDAVTSMTTQMGNRIASTFRDITVQFRAFSASGGLDSVASGLSNTASAFSGTGGVMAAAGVQLANMAPKIAGMLPGLGGISGFAMGPGLGTAVSLFASLIASSREFRESLKALGGALLGVFAQITVAMAPVAQAFQKIIDGIAPAAARLVESLAKVVVQVGFVAAAFLSAAAPIVSLVASAITPVVEAVSRLAQVFADSKVAVVAATAALAAFVGLQVASVAMSAVSGVMRLASAFTQLAAGITLAATAEKGARLSSLGMGMASAGQILGSRAGAAAAAGSASGAATAAGAAAGSASAASAGVGLAALGLTLPVVAGLAAVVATGVVAWKLYSSAQEESTKRGREQIAVLVRQQELMNQVSNSSGVDTVLRSRYTALQQVRGQAREEETSLNFPGSGILQDRLPFIANTLTAIKAVGNQPGIPGMNRAVPDVVTAALNVGKSDLANAYGDEFNKLVEDLADSSARSVSSYNERVNALADSTRGLAAQLSVPPEVFAQVVDLLPSQATLVNDQLSQMVSQTKNWRDTMSSFAAGLKDAWSTAQMMSQKTGTPANLSTDMVEESFAYRKASVSMFDADLRELTNLAQAAGENPTNLLRDLVAQGPEQVGDALRALMQNLADVPLEEARKVIGNMTVASNEIAESANKMIRDLVVDMMSGEMMDINNPEMATQFVTDYKNIMQDLENNRTSLSVASGSSDDEGLRRQSLKMRQLLDTGAPAGEVIDQSKVVAAAANRAELAGGEQARIATIARDSANAIAGQIGLYQSQNTQYQELIRLQGPQMEAAESLRVNKQSTVDALSFAQTPNLADNSYTQTAIRNSLDVIEGPAGDDLKTLFTNWGEEGYKNGSVYGEQLIAGLSREIRNFDSSITEALKPKARVSDETTQFLENLIRESNREITSANTNLDNYKNALEAVRREWSNLGQAINTVMSRQSDLITNPASVGGAAQGLGAAIQTGQLQGNNNPQIYRDVDSAAASAANAVKANVMAMAEARVIGRDLGSITAEMTKQFNALAAQVEAETQEWMRNNAVKVVAAGISNELSLSTGRLKASIQAQDGAVKKLTETQVALGVAMSTVPANARVQGETVIDIRGRVLSLTDSIEQMSMAWAANGTIANSVESIYNNIKFMVQVTIDQLNQQTAAVLTNEEALSAYSASWDIVVGRSRNVEQAQWGVNDAIRALTQTYYDYAAVATASEVLPEGRIYAWQQLGQSLESVVMAYRKQAEALVTDGQLANSPGAISEWITRQLKAMKDERPVLSNEIDEYIAKLTQIAPTADTTANLYKDTAIMALEEYMTRLDTIPPERRTTINVLTDRALAVINQFRAALSAIPDEKVYIEAVFRADEMKRSMQATFADAKARVAQFTNALEFLAGGGKYVSQAAMSAGGAYGPVDPAKFRQFDSSWMPQELRTMLPGERFADGGIREDHTAQIAQGGTYRMFAEPETGGEAYIPLSIAKRPRSEQLLRQVAAMFGGEFQQYAEGGIGNFQIDLGNPVVRASSWAAKVFTNRMGDQFAKDFTERMQVTKFLKDMQEASSFRALASSSRGDGSATSVGIGAQVGVLNGVPSARANGMSESVGGISPELISRFSQYNAALGNKFSITSGYRSYAEQAYLYDLYLQGRGNLAARPTGRSSHEVGLAIDHGPSASAQEQQFATNFRLRYNVPGEPWHLEPFMNGGIRKGTYDKGGVLEPGYTLAYNGTGKNEYVMTNDDAGKTVIQQMVVQTNLPPREWLDEAQWRRDRTAGV